MKKAYVALGSNMGDRFETMNLAVERIKADKNIQNVIVSDFIETKPYGYVEQDMFLNSVMSFDTSYTAIELLHKLQELEALAHRKREIRWGPRTLDLDIILYDDLVINTEELTLPHYDMHNRDFVLGPLVQIAPDAYHPVLKKTAKELLEMLG